MSIFEIKVKEQQLPVGIDVSIIYYGGPFEAKWFASKKDLDDIFPFFGDAKKALTGIAKHLADMQRNLSEADRKDCEKAMNRYVSRGFGGAGSYRTVSRATAELVHGLQVAGTKNEPVTISLEPFDIQIGKASKYGIKWRGMDDFKIDFMSQDTSDPSLTPGTKLILQSLQDAAEQMEAIVKKYSGASANYSGPLSIQAVTPQGYVNPYMPPPINTAVVLPNVSLPPMQDVIVGGTTRLVDDIHIVYKTGTGEYKIAKVESPSFEIGLMSTITNFVPGTGQEIVKIKGGSFKASDGTPFEGELPVARSARSVNSKNPSYWAHAAEDKLNGIRQQVMQNLPEDDPTRTLICAISDLLSDHIHGMGAES